MSGRIGLLQVGRLGLLLVAGCTVIRSESDFCEQPDVSMFAEVARRCDDFPSYAPCTLDGAAPDLLLEGDGAEGRGVVVLVRGGPFSDDMTLRLVAKPGSTLQLDIAATALQVTPEAAAATLPIPVLDDLALGELETVELQLRSADGCILATQDFQLAGLDELEVDGGAYALPLAIFSTIHLAGSISLFDADRVRSVPARLVATSRIDLAGEIHVDAPSLLDDSPFLEVSTNAAMCTSETLCCWNGAIGLAGAGGGGGAAGGEGAPGAEGGASGGVQVAPYLFPLVGGGLGGSVFPIGAGGVGGGAVELRSLGVLESVEGSISVVGAEAGGPAGGGGGGGSVLVRAQRAIGTLSLNVVGGAGGVHPDGPDGGAGATGRARIDAAVDELSVSLAEGEAVRGVVLSTPTIAIATVVSEIASGAPAVQLWVDGSLAMEGPPPLATSLPLEPGLHRLCAQLLPDTESCMQEQPEPLDPEASEGFECEIVAVLP